MKKETKRKNQKTKQQRLIKNIKIKKKEHE